MHAGLFLLAPSALGFVALPTLHVAHGHAAFPLSHWL